MPTEANYDRELLTRMVREEVGEMVRELLEPHREQLDRMSFQERKDLADRIDKRLPGVMGELAK